MDVLLLNASCEPLRFITVRRALGMVITGRAVMVAAGDGHVHSASDEFPVPLVVRLRQMVRIPFAARVPLNRRTLSKRDAGRCQVAGCPDVGSTIDHVVPRSRGGRHEWRNVVLMCVAHNRTKSDRLLSELGWRLKRAPRPLAPAYALMEVGEEPIGAWAPYLRAAA